MWLNTPHLQDTPPGGNQSGVGCMEASQNGALEENHPA